MPEPPPADLDLRLVRCFTVVAEYRHFGRAAEVLHVTQSSLSRQIARLEHQVGARLVDRTPRGNQLTEAGEAFLPRARESLNSAARGAAAARAAAAPNRITIGHTTNLILTPAVRELRWRHPDADVRTLHVGWDEPHAALLDHRVDAAVARLPFPTGQLQVTVLREEPRAVLVPRDHRLAGKESVTIDDIADEPIPRALAPEWDAFWRIDPRPDGSPAPDGPLLGDVGDKFEIIASGQAVAIVPSDSGITGMRPDLSTIPLRGVEPSYVVLATRADDRSRLVREFCHVAKTQLSAPSDDPDSSVG